MSEPSEIQKFLSGTKIFLTGGTGFVGKMVLEKLLRSCPDLEHVYLLVRTKKNKKQTDRIAELLQCPIFDSLKRARFDFHKKISIINGDSVLPELGMSEDDIKIIIEEVNIIIHCAATVRFDQKLSQATKINVRATRDLLNIAKKMKKLKSYVHVSTAYSNCDRKEIDEIVYEPKIEGSKLIQAVDSLNDELLFDMQSRLLGELQNTYILTKQVAEDVVKQEAQTLPVCIVRPSIIVGAADEPLKGFIDNYYGLTGLFLGCALGLLRTVLVNEKNVADLVPADFVVNHILAAAWHIGTERANREPKDPEVLNLVSGVDNAITLGQLMNYMVSIGPDYATKKIIWYPFTIRQTNRYVHSALHVLLHLIPGYIIDAIARIIGKEPIYGFIMTLIVEGMGKNFKEYNCSEARNSFRSGSHCTDHVLSVNIFSSGDEFRLVATYAKVTNAADIISYFPMHEWVYQNSNTKKLIEKMSPRDRELFNFDMKSIDWLDYIHFYIKGMRLYIVGDTPDTIEEGKAYFRKMRYIHYSVCSILIVLVYYFFRMLFGFLF